MKKIFALATKYNPEQLALPFAHTADSLCSLLQKASSRCISLKITDNTSSMVSLNKKPHEISVRLHHMFLGAGPDVIDELAGFVSGHIRKTPRISAFIRQRHGLVADSQARRPRLNPEGKYHDLLPIFCRLNAEYFSGRIKAGITWGNGTARRAVRRRTLGSYSKHTGTIRINTILDSPRVPAYFLSFVVYHEMIHADIGIGESQGRRVVHSRDFRKRERLFKYYEKARTWERCRYF